MDQYRRLVSLKTHYGDRVKFLILECPYYSITIWNRHKGHANPEVCNDKTDELCRKLDLLNEGIREVNLQLSVRSPKLSLDMITSRKSNKSHTTNKVSYNLLTDGVHPSPLLCKYWLKKLVLDVMLKECN